MPNKYVPEDLSLMESACVNWVLAAIKTDTQQGTPAEQAIDQALKEVNPNPVPTDQEQFPSGQSM